MDVYVRRMCHLAVTKPPLASQLCNRNPRNLERLRIARKPFGYLLDKPGRCYWNNLELTSSNRYITASVVHHLNGKIITASTSEWALRQQLYKAKDTCAFIALATVLAKRCLMFGITEMQCLIEATPNGKVEKFLNTLTEQGIVLKEPPAYLDPQPSFRDRPEKPWEVFEN